MTGWLIALRDRPIAEHERRAALTVTAAILIAATLALAITRVSEHQRPPSPATPAGPGAKSTADPSTDAPQASPNVSPQKAAHVARVFLAGYLAYTYGQAQASVIADASGALIRSLEAHPPRVSPGMRASRPRVLELHPAPAPGGLVGVSAVVNDGGLVDYTLVVLLTAESGRLLVTGLEQS